MSINQIKIGKKYKTRSGNTAEIKYQIYGYFCGHILTDAVPSGFVQFRWDLNGTAISDSSKFDIIFDDEINCETIEHYPV